MDEDLEALVKRRVTEVIQTVQQQQRYLVLSHPSMNSIKDSLVQQHPSMYEEIQVQWKEFESGMPNLFIEDVHRLAHANVLLLLNLRHKEILLDQLSVAYAIPRYGCKSLTVLVPFFPTGTMERVDTEGQVATAVSLSRMLCATPLTPSGPARFIIFDIHALQIRFYFNDSVLPILLSAMPLLLNLLKSRFASERVAVAFPDEGAKKRFGGFFKEAGYPVLLCSKVREGDSRVVRITEGNPKDHHCFIIDDLCNTGGTVIACRGALQDQGASKVSVFVTHGVFPQDSWKKFESSGFSHIFITDSIPETVAVFEKHRAEHGAKSVFEVVPLAPALHKYLQG